MTPHTRYLIDTLNIIYKKHKHVSVKLEAHWGTEYGHFLFQTYLAKDRDHRIGFDLNVYALLVTLYIIHENVYGDFDRPVIIVNPNVNLSLLP